MNKNIIRIAMHRLNLNEHEMAEALHISETKLLSYLSSAAHPSPKILKQIDIMLDQKVPEDEEDYFYGLRGKDPLSRLSELETAIRIDKTNNNIMPLLFYYINYKDYITRYAIDPYNRTTKMKMDYCQHYLLKCMYKNIKRNGKQGKYLTKKGAPLLKYLMQLY